MIKNTKPKRPKILILNNWPKEEYEYTQLQSSQREHSLYKRFSKIIGDQMGFDIAWVDLMPLISAWDVRDVPESSGLMKAVRGVQKVYIEQKKQLKRRALNGANFAIFHTSALPGPIYKTLCSMLDERNVLHLNTPDLDDLASNTHRYLPILQKAGIPMPKFIDLTDIIDQPPHPTHPWPTLEQIPLLKEVANYHAQCETFDNIKMLSGELCKWFYRIFQEVLANSNVGINDLGVVREYIARLTGVSELVVDLKEMPESKSPNIETSNLSEKGKQFLVQELRKGFLELVTKPESQHEILYIVQEILRKELKKMIKVQAKHMSGIKIDDKSIDRSIEQALSLQHQDVPYPSEDNPYWLNKRDAAIILDQLEAAGMLPSEQTPLHVKGWHKSMHNEAPHTIGITSVAALLDVISTMKYQGWPFGGGPIIREEAGLEKIASKGEGEYRPLPRSICKEYRVFVVAGEPIWYSFYMPLVTARFNIEIKEKMIQQATPSYEQKAEMYRLSKKIANLIRCDNMCIDFGVVENTRKPIFLDMCSSDAASFCIESSILPYLHALFNYINWALCDPSRFKSHWEKGLNMRPIIGSEEEHYNLFTSLPQKEVLIPGEGRFCGSLPGDYLQEMLNGKRHS